MEASITFCGAAKTVTGSKHLLEVNGKQILVDCGLFQGPREIRERNWLPWDFEPSQLDAVVITHAHTDHIGMLPKLVQDGYQKAIWSTKATLGIAKISLPDSGRLQEEEARYHNKHKSSRHTPALPLYNEQDAYAALKLFKTVHYHEPVSLPGGCSLRFLQAGHILGSAFAEITLPNGEVILFGGDLGRYNTPIIKDPEFVSHADYLVVESTYGDRLHGTEDAKAVLEEVLNNAFHHGRCILVPSFAIGRTQELLYYICQLQHEGKAPRVPIFLDSPMAVSATALYDRSAEDHDQDFKNFEAQGYDPLHPDLLELIRDRNASKALNVRPGPIMIISGSGMATGGRIVHHLLKRVSDPSTIVLFTGYQGVGTLGRDMIEGEEFVRILGNEVEVKAEVRQMTSLSAHADQGEIMLWLGGFEAPPKQTFIVHGEPPAQEALQIKIEHELGWKTMIPSQSEKVILRG